MGKVHLTSMISYGPISCGVANMDVISFDHSDSKSVINKSEYYTTIGNSDTTQPDIFHKLLHSNEENNWLQDTDYCSESNCDTTDQQQFSGLNCQYMDTISNALESYNGFEAQPSFHAYTVPENNTTQLLHEIAQNAQTKYSHEIPETNHINKGTAQFHRAYISLINTSQGSFKAIVKRKRKRTVFTTEQIEGLEEYFCQNQYITRQERQRLVKKLHLNDKAMKIWFQNRRLKGKRDQDSQETTNSFVINNETLQLCLEFVESQINERTNESGYVTLDDTLTGNLLHVIDAVLANKNHIELLSEEDVTEIENKPIYEPVSPAEVYTNSEMLSEPNECLQRIIDLQTILSI